MLTAVLVMCAAQSAPPCAPPLHFPPPRLARNPVDPKSRLSSSFGKGVTEQTVYPAYAAISGENGRCCQ
jgi:hypothetical protein